VVFAPIGSAIGVFVVAGIAHLLVRLVVGATNAGFGATFRVAAYTSVTSLVSWIPFVGGLLALYGIYLAVVGIREMHDTTTRNGFGRGSAPGDSDSGVGVAGPAGSRSDIL
jgi:hypothetical protein